MCRLAAIPVAVMLMTAGRSSATDVPGAPTDVHQFVKAFVQAINEGDMTAVMAMYSRNPVVASVVGGEITRGWDAIRAGVERAVGSEGSYKVSLGVVDVVPLGASHALAYVSASVTIATAQGVMQIPGAYTFVLEKSPDRWKILHEHFSANFQQAGAQVTPTSVYYRNCAEARAAGAAPIYRGQAGYRPELDRDGDGVACER